MYILTTPNSKSQKKWWYDNSSRTLWHCEIFRRTRISWSSRKKYITFHIGIILYFTRLHIYYIFRLDLLDHSLDIELYSLNRPVHSNSWSSGMVQPALDFDVLFWTMNANLPKKRSKRCVSLTPKGGFRAWSSVPRLDHRSL